MNGDFIGISSIFISTLLFSAYILVGKQARRSCNSNLYIFSLYFFASMVCLLLMLLLGEPIISYTPRNFLFFLLLALIPTIIGHGSLNHSVGHFRASTVSMLTLLEPIVASIAAYLCLNERISFLSILGFITVCIAVGLLFRSELLLLFRTIFKANK